MTTIPHVPTIEDEKMLARFRREMKFVIGGDPAPRRLNYDKGPNLGSDFSGRRRDLIENEDGSKRLGPEYVPDMPRFTPPNDTIEARLEPDVVEALRAIPWPKRRRTRRRKPKAVTV